MFNQWKITAVRVLIFFFFPTILFAAPQTIAIFDRPASSLNFTTLVNKFAGIANVVIPFLVGLAIVVTVWAIFKYIASAGDSEKMADARKAMLYAILALFLMLSFWGFVMIIKRTLLP